MLLLAFLVARSSEDLPVCLAAANPGLTVLVEAASLARLVAGYPYSS